MTTESNGPQRYLCVQGLLFLKRSTDPTSGKIVKLKRPADSTVHATGRLWTGPSGGVWAELDASQEETGWVLVEGPGFGLDGAALIDAAKGMVSDIWPTHPRDDESWQELLSPRHYSCLRGKETEPKNTGEYNEFYPVSGHFKCAGCDEALYSAESKFSSGCGWPSFSRCYVSAAGQARVVAQVDWQIGGKEILCRRCGGHLGHVFNDGSATGSHTMERHCVNSLSVVYDEAPAPSPGPNHQGPPEEDFTDQKTFKNQMKEHLATGAYPTVV